MTKTRILLGSALVLSLAAFMSAITKPQPQVAKPGEVAVSNGKGVRIEARQSHSAVHESGSELFTELTVTLVDDGTVTKLEQAASIALVLDTSGSMSGSKMDDARRAAHRLVDSLTERDQLTLVTFGSEVTSTAPQYLTADAKAALHATIDTLQPAGSTFMSGGLERGWSMLRGAQGSKRLVLVSDGQPTMGLTTEAELALLAGRVHDDSITVTALGVGADIDGPIMMHLSERGGGMYGYLKDAGALEEILGREVTAARTPSVRNVELALDTTLFGVAEAPGRHLTWKNEKQVLHLADLPLNVPTRVLLKLKSAPALPGEYARLAASVTWSTLDGPSQRNEVAVETPVVEDAELVTRSRDEAVFSRGVSAVGSEKLLAAVAAWERGDSRGATSLLDNARALFGMSADALAGSDVDEVRQRLSKSASAEDKRDYQRKLERKKLSNFGLENSGY